MKTETVSKRVLWASLIGSSIEWFDYFLYGTVAALVFNQLFFPAEDPAVGTMLARMHLAGCDFARHQPNLRGLPWWNETVQIGRASCRERVSSPV